MHCIDFCTSKRYRVRQSAHKILLVATKMELTENEFSAITQKSNRLLTVSVLYAHNNDKTENKTTMKQHRKTTILLAQLLKSRMPMVMLAVKMCLLFHD